MNERSSNIIYTRIGNRDNLEKISIVDALYKYDENLIGGDLIFIKEAVSSRASLVYWKTKQIQKTAHSSKDAETLNISKLVDDAVYISRQVEMLLYGDIKGRIPVKLFTDFEPTRFHSIIKTGSEKLLRMTIKDLKDKCFEGEVLSYAWLPVPMKEMMADCLTKEMKMPSSMEAVIKDYSLVLNKPFINEVKNVNGEL